MIDAIAVVEIGAALGTVLEPEEVVVGHALPVVEGHAPVLAGFAEGVRRRADGDVEMEAALVRPDIGAVGIHHERQIAEERHAAGARGVARARRHCVLASHCR